MKREDEFIGHLQGYLDEFEGLTPLPDAIRDAVRAELPAIKQIGASAGPMRYLTMSIAMPAPARYGLVAAVVVVAAALGAAFFTRAGGTGAIATPTPTLVAPASTLIEPSGSVRSRDLAAGSYYLDRPFPVHLSFEVPQGMIVWAYTAAGSQVNLIKGHGEVSFEIVDNITADPCSTDLLDPPVGTSVDDLVTALSHMAGFQATAVTDITIDGFLGKQLTLTAPDSDPRCESLLTWKTTTRQNGVSSGEVNEVTVLDVDGVRLLICIAYQPSTPAAAVSQLQAVMGSVQIDPLGTQ